MTPQQLRDSIKADHPDYYGTESHRRNVEKGHYKDLDHALLAQIYVAARSASNISVDKSQKPIRLTVMPGPVDDGSAIEEEIDTEDLEKLEAGVGTMCVLGKFGYLALWQTRERMTMTPASEEILTQRILHVPAALVHE